MTEQEWLNNIMVKLKEKHGKDCTCRPMSDILPPAAVDPNNNRYLFYLDNKLVHRAIWEK